MRRELGESSSSKAGCGMFARMREEDRPTRIAREDFLEPILAHLGLAKAAGDGLFHQRPRGHLVAEPLRRQRTTPVPRGVPTSPRPAATRGQLQQLDVGAARPQIGYPRREAIEITTGFRARIPASTSPLAMGTDHELGHNRNRHRRKRHPIGLSRAINRQELPLARPVRSAPEIAATKSGRSPPRLPTPNKSP